MAITAMQLVGKVSIEGVPQAMNSLKRIGQATEELQASLSQRLASSVSHARNNFLSLASQATIVAGGMASLVQSAMDAGKALLMPAMNAEATKEAFTTLLGSTEAANGMLAKLRDFAKTTPFEFPEIAETAQQMLALGFSANDIQPMLLKVGDAVSAMNKGAPEMDRVMTALGQIKNRTKLTTEEMNQLIDVGVFGWQKLADGLGVTTAQAQKMAADGLIPADKAINIALKSMGQFSGGMDRASKTALGMASTLKDNLNTALERLGSGILEPLKGSLKFFNDQFEGDAINNFATAVGQNLGNALLSIGNFMNSTIIPAFQQMKPTVEALAGAFSSPHFLYLKNALSDLGVTISGVIMPVLQPLIDKFNAMFSNSGAKAGADGLKNAMMGLGDAINFINPFIAELPTHWQNLQNTMAPVGAFLTNTFKPVWDNLVSTFNTQIQPAFEKFMTALQPLLPQLQTLGAIIGGVLVVNAGLFFSAFAALINGFITGIPHIINAFSGLVTYFSGAFDFIGNLFGFFVNLFTGKFDQLGSNLAGMGQGIVKMFTGTWQIVSGLFMGALGFITGTVTALKDNVIRLFQGLYNTLVGNSIVPDMINGIIRWFTGLPGRVMGFVSDMVSRVIGKFGEMYNSAVGKVGEIVNTITSKLSGLGSSALSWGSSIASNFAQGILNSLGEIGNAANQAMQKAADFLKPGSPTKEGVGRSLMEWGPDLIGHYADTMKSAFPSLARVASEAAKTAMGPLSNPIGVSYTASGMSDVSTRLSSFSSGVALSPAGLNLSPRYSGGSSPTLGEIEAILNKILLRQVVIDIDGHRLSTALMPSIVDVIRNGAGHRSY